MTAIGFTPSEVDGAERPTIQEVKPPRVALRIRSGPLTETGVVPQPVLAPVPGVTRRSLTVGFRVTVSRPPAVMSKRSTTFQAPGIGFAAGAAVTGPASVAASAAAVAVAASRLRRVIGASA